MTIEHYQRVLKLFDGVPFDEDQLYFDTFMRLGICFAKLERWWDAVYAFENLVSLDWLDEHDRMEIQLGKGITFEGAGEMTLAESACSRVPRIYTVGCNAAWAAIRPWPLRPHFVWARSRAKNMRQLN